MRCWILNFRANQKSLSADWGYAGINKYILNNIFNSIAVIEEVPEKIHIKFLIFKKYISR